MSKDSARHWLRSLRRLPPRLRLCTPDRSGGEARLLGAGAALGGRHGLERARTANLAARILELVISNYESIVDDAAFAKCYEDALLLGGTRKDPYDRYRAGLAQAVDNVDELVRFGPHVACTRRCSPWRIVGCGPRTVCRRADPSHR
jgi:hypothetical protein